MQTLVFKTTLNPTPAQATQLASHVGAVRFSYNWALAHIQANWEAVKTNPEIEYVNTSAYSLRKELNLVKAKVAPWWDQNSKEAFATGTANANKALTNWHRGRKLNKQTGEVASGRWDKAHRQVVKTHAKISNQRTDFLHKTSKQLVENNQIIGVETLSIKNMVKNRHLSLSISDAGWGEFTRQLAYKAARYGGQLIKIDPFYPSSKTCSKCETVKTKLLLSERTFKCDNCGLIIDRDLNAAINIKNQALRMLVVAQSCGETLNERGGTSTGLPVMVSETSPSETLSGTIEPQPI